MVQRASPWGAAGSNPWPWTTSFCSAAPCASPPRVMEADLCRALPLCLSVWYTLQALSRELFQLPHELELLWTSLKR